MYSVTDSGKEELGQVFSLEVRLLQSLPHDSVEELVVSLNGVHSKKNFGVICVIANSLLLVV